MAGPTALAALSAAWLANPWLVWGAAPMISVAAGFLGTALLLEAVLAAGAWSNGRLLVYGGAGTTKRRAEMLAATRARIPLRKQLMQCLYIVLGPNFFLNGLSLVLIMKAVGAGAPAAWWPASWATAAAQFLLMAVIADFGLYWGHRAQHEFDALWRVHRVHHRIDTPSPLSTMYIHGLDATLQGGLPMALAAALVRPPPGVLCLAFAARVAENAANHSGLASPLLDLAFLKCLPLRAPVSWHDAHHKYCNHPRNARNYAESFVVWDWLFGTVNPRAGTPQGPLAAGDGKQAKE